MILKNKNTDEISIIPSNCIGGNVLNLRKGFFDNCITIGRVRIKLEGKVLTYAYKEYLEKNYIPYDKKIVLKGKFRKYTNHKNGTEYIIIRGICIYINKGKIEDISTMIPILSNSFKGKIINTIVFKSDNKLYYKLLKTKTKSFYDDYLDYLNETVLGYTVYGGYVPLNTQ